MGELYTQNASVVLLTHQQVCPDTIYAGLVKRVVLGSDTVLRTVWWDANDILRGTALTISPIGSLGVTECVSACLQTGIWFEGSFVVGGSDFGGLWLQTSGSAGFAFGVSLNTGGLNFNWTDGIPVITVCQAADD